MSGFPTQLSWRRFACLLRDLGYRPLKSHRGSVRQFFGPTGSPNLASFPEPYSARHTAQSDLATLFGSPDQNTARARCGLGAGTIIAIPPSMTSICKRRNYVRRS